MLNYAALNDPLTPQDIEAVKALQSTSSAAWRIVGIVLFVVVIVSFISGILTSIVMNGGVAVSIPAIVVFAIIVGVSILIGLSMRAYRRAMARVYKFALQNNATFSLTRRDLVETGVIFGAGHSRVAESVVEFASGLRVANYRYTTGSGKNSQTHYWSYARMPLERHVPNMVLDAKSNNAFRRFSNLPVAYKATQVEKIHPELDKLYTLYTPDNYEIDTYYLFTPDVIAALVDGGGRYDIEIVDNIIYFYTQFRMDLSKQVNWENLLRVVAPVAKELREQADYYADAKAGVPRSADVIAPEGRRLRRGIAASTVFAIAVIVVYYVIMFISDMK